MIQRLITTLHVLATIPMADLAAADRQQLFGDCADAVRLELDCPQQNLTVSQRSALTQLGDLLEGGADDPAGIATAARRAHDALGLTATPLR